MDINVNINGLDRSLTEPQQRRVDNAVRAAVVKTMREEDDKSPLTRTIVFIQDTPTLFQAFLSTTYGMMIFLFTVAIIAIPAAAMGGALYVSNQQSAPIYKLTDKENNPSPLPAPTPPAKDTIRSAG